MKKLLNKIVLLMVALLMPVQSVLAVTINSLKYYDSSAITTFDIYGTINGDKLLNTSYDLYGYTVFFKVKNQGEADDENSTFADYSLNTYKEDYEGRDDYPQEPIMDDYPDFPDDTFVYECPDAGSYRMDSLEHTFEDAVACFNKIGDSESAAKAQSIYEFYVELENRMYTDSLKEIVYQKEQLDYFKEKRAEEGKGIEVSDVNSQEVMVRFLPNGGEITKDGVKLNIKGIETVEGNSVRVEYTLTNTNDTAKEYSTATISDTELALNDFAAVVKNGKQSITVTQDRKDYDVFKEFYGAQLFIDFETEVTTSWIGKLRDYMEMRYTEGDVTSITADNHIDTALTYSWSGTLDPGESVTKVAIFSVKNANVVKVNLFKKGNTTGKPDEVIETVKDGIFEVPANDSGKWITQVNGETITLDSGTTYLVTSDVLNLYEPADEITAIGFDGEYDGEEHFVTILGTLPGDTVTYSTDGVNYSSTVPKYSDIGTHTTYYKVERAGEDAITGTSTIKISPKVLKSEDITISVGNPEKEYTGSAIEPEVTVKHDSTVIPSSEYDVTYDNNTEIGVASVTVSDKDGGNYIIEDTTSYFEIVAPGKVNVIEPSTPNSYSGSFAETPILVKSKIELTDEEKQKLIDGKNMDIYLEVKDISDSISKEEKNKIDKKLSKGDTVGLYLDVSLFKKFDGENPEKINSTKKPIKVTFEIPEKLRKEERKFVIYRYHNGTVTELNVTVEGNYATFETDEFSSFALAYNDSNETSNPKTGDNIIYYVGVLVLSIVGLIYLKNKRVN